MTEARVPVTDAELIAKVLTKAGGIILCRMRPDFDSEAFYLRSSADVWAPGPTLAALARLGLVHKVTGTAPQRYRLTQLGEQVRAAIRQMGGE